MKKYPVIIITLLTKDTDPDEFVRLVCDKFEGEVVMYGESFPRDLNNRVFPAASKAIPGILTLRETEIIRLLARGHSTKEIAAYMGIEITTVESHKERIKEKLGVKTVLQMVLSSLKRGIIALEE